MKALTTTYLVSSSSDSQIITSFLLSDRMNSPHGIFLSGSLSLKRADVHFRRCSYCSLLPALKTTTFTCPTRKFLYDLSGFQTACLSRISFIGLNNFKTNKIPFICPVPLIYLRAGKRSDAGVTILHQEAVSDSVHIDIGLTLEHWGEFREYKQPLTKKFVSSEISVFHGSVTVGTNSLVIRA